MVAQSVLNVRLNASNGDRTKRYEQNGTRTKWYTDKMVRTKGHGQNSIIIFCVDFNSVEFNIIFSNQKSKINDKHIEES